MACTLLSRASPGVAQAKWSMMKVRFGYFFSTGSIRAGPLRLQTATAMSWSMNEPEHQKLLAEGAFEPVWKACIDQDMAVAVWTRSGPALMEPVLKKYPNLTFIIDHFAWATPGEARERKVLAMESLARFRNVHVKVSSLPLVSGSAPPEYEDLHPLIKRVHAAYGAERLMWGSDQTQTMGKNRGTYAQNADIIRKYAASYLPAADVQMMMHGTAARVFKWPAE